MKNQLGRLRVGILGTGKIGTDLLLKIERSTHLKCVLFSGRNPNSEGIKKAQELGIATSSDSIHAFTNNPLDVQLVFDATSAEHHRNHAPVFDQLKIKTVDLTPARIGPLCVPLLNEDVIHTHNNINMVTCGGQSSIPVIHALANILPHANAVSLHSSVSADSIGQATLDNIDDYYATTASAISEFTGIACQQIALDVNQDFCTEMVNTIHFSLGENVWSNINLDDINAALHLRMQEINQYVPGYRLLSEPHFDEHSVEIKVAVRGQGDWIPEHAGNLDIINCAALSIAEKYAIRLRADNTQSIADKIKAFVRRSRPNFAEGASSV